MPNPLSRWIAARLEADGPVPFARFMEWCLYHPEHGYYSAGRVRVGADQGDFTTAPHVSPLFAACLARFVAAAHRCLGAPAAFTVIEGGPGEGRLAADLLDTLARRQPDLYRRLCYRLDERSPALLERQVQALAAHRDKVATGLPDAPVTGVYLSNELVDALPVHRLRRVGGELLEVFVALEGGALAERLLPPADPAVAAAAEALEPAEGCTVEVRPGAREWLARAAGCLARGAVLTADYGDTAARLFGPHHPDGTGVAYRAHRQHTDLLAEPGEQDLTAQVDFDALAAHGAALGLRAEPLQKQREFLFAQGLVEELEAIETSDLDEVAKLELRRAAAPLLMPGAGMGDAFKVLVQWKDGESRGR